MADERKAPRRREVEARYRPEETPLSSSGVVIRRGPGSSGTETKRRRHFDSERALTPYQARLDVAMDDTQVSKVRDPSVSISLSGEPVLDLQRSAPPVPRNDALVSVLAGIALGAALVVLIVYAARAVFG